MKIGVVICGPDVAHGPLALFSGSFEEKALKAKNAGCDGVELMVRDPDVLHWDKVKATLDGFGLEVPQVVTGELYGAEGLCLVTPDTRLFERALQRARRVVDLAAYLGAMVNIGRLRGRLEGIGEEGPAWETALGRLRPLVDYAAEKNVRLTLEPLNRYETDFVLTAADGLRLIKDLGYENLGLMLDLFHMNIEEDSFCTALRTAGGRLWHVHVADTNRNFPGSGHLDFAPIFQTLAELRYSGYLSGELRPLPDADTAGQKTVAFLRTRLDRTSTRTA